jgi:hypothetical protein
MDLYHLRSFVRYLCGNGTGLLRRELRMIRVQWIVHHSALPCYQQSEEGSSHQSESATRRKLRPAVRSQEEGSVQQALRVYTYTQEKTGQRDVIK